VTIRQGFRVGASAYHGPYLHRQHAYSFPGEANPKSLPATGYGADVQWGRGRLTVNAELQRFQFPYRAIPYYFHTAGYGETKVTLSPRWYLAGRVGTGGARREWAAIKPTRWLWRSGPPMASW
jgi:hypothetical protein